MKRPSMEVHISISPEPYFYTMLHYFLASFTRNAGACVKKTKFIVTVGSDQPPFDLGVALPWTKDFPVEWRWIEPELFRKYSWHAQAVAIFQHPFTSDIVARMDPDIVVTGSLDEAVGAAYASKSLTGLIAHISPFARMKEHTNREYWEMVFRSAGLPLPEFRYQHSVWPRMFGDPECRTCPAYFNGGVLFAPAKAMEKIGSTIFQEMDAVDRLFDTFFKGQLAITLATERHHIACSEMDWKFNFPSTKKLSELGPISPETLEDVRVWHYMGEGEINKRVDFANPQAVEKMLARQGLNEVTAVFQKKIRLVHEDILRKHPDWLAESFSQSAVLAEDVQAVALRLQTRLEKAGESADALVKAFAEPNPPVTNKEVELLRKNAEQAKQDGNGELAAMLIRLADIAATNPSPKMHWEVEAAGPVFSPVFLVGAMRSGTTLLAKLLDGFPEIVYCPFELKCIWSETGGVPMASPRTADRHCPPLQAADARPGQADALQIAFLAEMQKRTAEKPEGRIFLNKNPHLCNKLPLVNALFPNARFIWIHRPLPQMAASQIRLFERVQKDQGTWEYWPSAQPKGAARCWDVAHQPEPPAEWERDRVFPGGNIQNVCEYWLETNRAAAEFFQRMPKERWIEVAEHDLLEHPDREIKRCLALLGIPREVPESLLSGIDRSKISEWKTLLSAGEFASIGKFLRDHGDEIQTVFARREYQRMEEHHGINPASAVVAVVGMHRSGTSMIARMLNLCGMDLGEEADIAPANIDNTEGFWENKRFVEINDAILNAFGAGWDAPPDVRPGWEFDARIQASVAEAQHLVDAFREKPFWGWKDPRTSVLLPFWKRFVPGLKVVICLRNPLDVARSLHARNNFSLAAGFRIWRAYMRRLIDAAKPEERVVVRYDSFFENPAAELERLRSRIGVEVPAEQVRGACSTVKKEARHHASSLEDMVRAGAPLDVVDIYQSLCEEAGGSAEESRAFYFGTGFYGDEGGWRWMGPLAELLVPPSKLPAVVSLTFHTAPKSSYSEFPVRISLAQGAAPLAEAEFQDGGEQKTLTARVGKNPAGAIIRLEASQSFVPSRLGTAQDDRELSIQVNGVSVEPLSEKQPAVAAAVEADRTSYDAYPRDPEKVKPVFVVGSPRSGTSILVWCLGQHPNLLPIEESSWFGKLALDLLPAYEIGSARGRYSQLSNMCVTEDEFFREFGVAVQQLILPFKSRRPGRPAGSPAPANSELKRFRAPEDPKARWVDGTPEYSFYIAGLLKLFPQAKFIHILRDVQSVVKSMVRLHTETGMLAGTEQLALDYWLRTVKACVEAERALGSETVMRIRYQDFIDQPEATLGKCFDFLGEPYSPESLLPLKVKINSSHVPETTEAEDSATDPVMREEAYRLSANLLAEAEPHYAYDAGAKETWMAKFYERARYIGQLDATLQRTQKALAERERELSEARAHAEDEANRAKETAWVERPANREEMLETWQGVFIGSGIYPDEGGWRWLGARAKFTIPAAEIPRELRFHLTAPPAWVAMDYPLKARILLTRHEPITVEFVKGDQDESVVVEVEPWSQARDFMIETSATFIPAKLDPEKKDQRQLGLRISNFNLVALPAGASSSKPVCVVCGSNAGFELHNPQSPRESWVCRRCGSTSRDRMFILGLARAMGNQPPLANWPANTALRILESAGMRAHPPYLRQKYTYWNTEFDPEALAGSNVDKTRYADLQSLHYDDHAFDVVMNSDVFEHVRLYKQALAEIYRVLKPGGFFLFQAPMDLRLPATKTLVQPVGDKDEYLEPPSYHGGHTLVYRFYGADVLADMRAVGFEPEVFAGEFPEYCITDQSLIIARKPVEEVMDEISSETASQLASVAFQISTRLGGSALVTPTDVARAAENISRRLSSENVIQEFLTGEPLVNEVEFALLEINAEQADADGRTDLAGAYRQIIRMLRESRFPAQPGARPAPQTADWKTMVEEADKVAGEGKYAEAISILGRCAAEYPEQPEVHALLATILTFQQRYREASDAVRRAIALSPDDARLFHMLGTLMTVQGNLQSAAAAFVRALQIDPEYHEAKLNLDAVDAKLRQASSPQPRSPNQSAPATPQNAGDRVYPAGQCPCCGGKQCVVYQDFEGYRYYSCGDCESLFIDPDHLESVEHGENLVKYQEDYWSWQYVPGKEHAYGLAMARMAEVLHYARIPVKHYLDIGTGTGYFLDAVSFYLPTRADRFHAVEKFPPIEEHRTKNPNYHIGEVGDLPMKIDAGMCIEVVEHMTPNMVKHLFAMMAAKSNPEAIYIFNTGLPEYVKRENPGYLNPVKDGHLISYSLKAIARMAEPFGFTVFPLKGKKWAFILEYLSRGKTGEDLESRIWTIHPENRETLEDPKTGSVIRILGMESARAYK